MFFLLFLNILIPNVAEKIFWFWWRKKKIWFRVFVKILYVYGDNFGRVTVTRLGSYVALQKVKHHKKLNQAEGSIMNKINNYNMYWGTDHLICKSNDYTTFSHYSWYWYHFWFVFKISLHNKLVFIPKKITSYILLSNNFCLQSCK
jgi:hypothetical protein